MSLSQINISRYKNLKDTKGSMIPLYEELRNIKNGKYKNEIESCRDSIKKNDLDSYSELKATLPAVTFSGVFHGKRRANEISIYNNLIVIDIDGLSDDNVILVKTELCKDIYILSAWISPSGRGIKALIKTGCSLEQHTAVFNSISSYLQSKYSIEIDPSGKDVSRLCFSSYDDNIYFNINALPYNELIEEVPITKKNSKTKSEEIVLHKNAHATEGLNKPENRELIKDIIKFLKNNKLSITANYNDWLKVAFAISYSFSYDVGEKYFLELAKLDLEKHNHDQSIALLVNCYNRRNSANQTVSISSIIYLAKQKGYLLKGER